VVGVGIGECRGAVAVEKRGFVRGGEDQTTAANKPLSQVVFLLFTSFGDDFFFVRNIPTTQILR
jgi:hypothetical protein